jgi:hypothetical protein
MRKCHSHYPPVQTLLGSQTESLAGLWNRTWHQVRKTAAGELRRRVTRTSLTCRFLSFTVHRSMYTEKYCACAVLSVKQLEVCSAHFQTALNVICEWLLISHAFTAEMPDWQLGTLLLGKYEPVSELAGSDHEGFQWFSNLRLG